MNKRHAQLGAAVRATSVILFSLMVTAGAAGEKIKDIHPAGYVTDLAKILDSDSKQRIETLCAEVERATGAQIAVVTVRSLEGESKEQYAADLFKHLGVGQKKDDRGVLLLIAPQERQYRIEVGYGLEPVINDAKAGDIGRSMVPLLRRSRYGDAAESAVKQLANLISVESGATPQPSAPSQPTPDTGTPIWPFVLVVFLLAAFVSLVRLAVRSATRGRRRRGPPGFWWLGPFMGGGGWGGGFGGSSGGFSGGGGFGGFGGGLSGGGGAGGSW